MNSDLNIPGKMADFDMEQLTLIIVGIQSRFGCNEMQGESIARISAFDHRFPCGGRHNICTR